MTKVLSQFNKSWLRWSLYTAIGSGLGYLIVTVLSLYPDQYYSHFLIALGLVGFFTSIGQWIILHTKLRHAWLWIPATTVGFILGYDAYKFMLPVYEIYALIFPVSVGLFVGVFQSLAMRSNIKNSLVWIAVSMLGWSLGYRVIFPAFFMKLDLLFLSFWSGHAADLFSSFFFGALTGLVIGMMSGLFIDMTIPKPNSIVLGLPQEAAS